MSKLEQQRRELTLAAQLDFGFALVHLSYSSSFHDTSITCPFASAAAALRKHPLLLLFFLWEWRTALALPERVLLSWS